MIKKYKNFRILGLATSLFIAFAILAISTPVFSIDVTYKSMRFVKAGYKVPRVKYRTYLSVFSKQNTRYIHVEFLVHNLYKLGRHRFKAQAKVYTPSGKLMAAPSLKFVVPKGSGRRYYTLRSGYSTSGLWVSGRYKVRLYIEDRWVATKYFSVYSRPYGSSGSSSGGSSSSGSRFPDPKEYGKTGGSYSIWRINNATKHTLYISYHGPGGAKSVSIRPYNKKNITLSAGTYNIHGSLSKSSIKAFSKKKYFKYGTKYRSRFYIKKYRRSKPKKKYDYQKI